MENLNGRKLVEEGDLCERRNGLVVYLINFKYDKWQLLNLCQWWNFSSIAGRGVDLNRNWSVDWGKKEKVLLFVIFMLGHTGFSFFLFLWSASHSSFASFFLVGFYPLVMVDMVAWSCFWLIRFTWWLNGWTKVHPLLFYSSASVESVFLYHYGGYHLFKLSSYYCRIMIHTKKIPELLLLVSLRLKWWGNCVYHSNSIYGLMCTRGWK